ncbi:MAG: hypothetical protein HY322_06045 [Betaproteobacteria bacterium]|nr:hypothetical protein [Betaproteobacteria bacterium]
MNISDITTGHILYYPSIEFQSEPWLKAALCTWDKVYRIVPGTYIPQDSDEVKRAVDAGLVENVTLSSLDLAETARGFESFCENLPVTPAGLEGYESVDLHRDKVDARIVPLLLSLAQIVKENGFVTLSPQIANAYMLFLAHYVSHHRGMPKLTDNADMFSLMQYFANDGQFDEFTYNPEASEATVALTLQTLLPAGLSSFPMARVLAFRQQNAEGRAAYRNMIASTSEELTKVKDEHHARAVLLEMNDRLRASAHNWSRVLHRLRFDIGYGLLSIGLPTSLTAMGTILTAGGTIGTSTVVGSLVIGSVATLANAARSATADWKQQDALYHLQLHGVFQKDGELRVTTPRYARAFEEFMND